MINEEIRRLKSALHRHQGYAKIYAPILRPLSIPDEAIRVATGDIRLPFRRPPIVQVFPPALIPLWSTESGIVIGFWRHWPVDCRKSTIVEFYGDTMFGPCQMVVEVARDFRQLWYLLLQELVSTEGGVTPTVERTARALAFDDLKTVEKVVEEHGDLAEGFRDHPAFAADPPLSCFDEQSEYPGDFPQPSMSISSHSLQSACSYEIHSEFRGGKPDYTFRSQIEMLSEAPEWLRAKEQRPVFRRLLENADFAGAWMSLNSAGWTFEDAQWALRSLAEAAKDSLLVSLAEIWCALPFPGDSAL